MRRLLLLVLLLGLSVSSALGQTQLINSSLVVVGHENMCTTGPTSTTGNAYACTLDRAITQYVARACFAFVADVANSGTATLNLHSLGAKTIVKVQGGITTALIANDIRAGQIVHVCYDGTNWQMISQLGNAPSGTVTISGTPTAGQNAEWTNATTIQGVAVTGTGSYVKATSPTLSTSLLLSGSTSGTITIQPQAAAGTFNFNLPTTAGTSGLPLLSGGGAAAPMTWGTRSGTTTTYATTTGTLVSGNCVKIDASGNLVDNGTTCGGGGGGTPGGSTTQVQYNNAGAFAGTSGLTASATAITSVRQGVTASAADISPLATHNVIACDASGAARTYTLPAATATLLGQAYRVIKVDTSVNACTMAPATGERINNVPNGTKAALLQNGDVQCLLLDATTPNWQCTSAIKWRDTKTFVIGADNGPTLVDADLGPQLHQWRVPMVIDIEEIAVYANVGTPSVIVHRRTGTTNTALLSTALATAAAGAVACAKTTATTSLDGATTCSATLQNNTAIPAGHTLGLTSGTASTAQRVSIAVTYSVVQ